MKKFIGTCFAALALVFSSLGSTAFTFNYDVGTVQGYHAYAYAAGVAKPQPAGTVLLLNYWVWDLGPVSGTGTVAVPSPVRDRNLDIIGAVWFANEVDVGGNPWTHPAIDVRIFTSKWYGGAASIQDDFTGTDIFFGAPFSPFGWDLTPYVW